MMNTIEPLARIVVAVAVALSVLHYADAQSTYRSDSDVLAILIGEETLSQNTRAVVHTARNITDDVEKQYQYLLQWVVPARRPSLLRLDGYFTTTDPIPKEGVARAGGEIESPALELIRVAKRAGKLDELFQHISDIPDGDNPRQRCKAALLAMIEIARGRFDDAVKQSEKFYALVSQSDVPLTDRWPELLLTSIAYRVPELHDVTNDIFAVLQPVSDKVRESPLGLHLQAVMAQLDFGESETLKLWHPSARATASTRGAGHPGARWFVADNTAQGVTSHHIDFLHYQIPLTGNYEVEAEVSIAPYQNGVFFVGGNWLSTPGVAGVYRGDYRSSHGYTDFEHTKLPKPRLWSRYRTAVRGNQITTLFNGRELERREFGYAPWLALRNDPGKRGAVRYLQIRGQPIIPDTVYPLLEGARSWKAYLDNEERRWSTSDEHPNGFMTGARQKRAGNVRIESLAHYHRPVIENGVIEYEFFYEANQFTAHPALERLVFLLDSDGVRLHWVDDGKYDQTFDRQNSTSESKPVSPPLALNEKEWNRVSLTFQDDSLQVAVNGVYVYTHRMIQNQRRLGLYYLANESTLQVRNMTWTGDWPKRLPASSEQELAGEQPDFLAEIQDMQEHTRIDFRQPIDASRFDTPGNSSQSKSRSEPAPKGIRVQPDVTPGYTSYWIRDQRRFFGDFDATMRFSDLTGSAETGQADFTLRFIDEHGNRYSADRGFRPDRNQLAALKWMVLGQDNTKTYGSDYTGDEATEGTLRLIRLEDTIYAMIAYGDSDRFHLLSTRKVLHPESAMMLRMEASRTKTSTLSAVLEEIVIRTFPPGEQNRDPRVTALERYKQKYDQTVSLDFSKPVDHDLVIVRQATTTPSGLTLTANQSPASATFQNTISGDFDAAIKLGKLALNADSKLAVTLDAGKLDDFAESTTIELSVQRVQDESYQVIARTQTQDSEANELGTFVLSSVETLRLIRIQRTLFLVCKGKAKSRMIGYADIGTGDIAAGSIKIGLATPNESASAELKSLQIRSSKPSRLGL
ncbi:MAG: DUF1583 domain-containing protein [Pirellulaceae bacterium]